MVNKSSSVPCVWFTQLLPGKGKRKNAPPGGISVRLDIENMCWCVSVAQNKEKRSKKKKKTGWDLPEWPVLRDRNARLKVTHRRGDPPAERRVAMWTIPGHEHPALHGGFIYPIIKQNKDQTYSQVKTENTSRSSHNIPFCSASRRRNEKPRLPRQQKPSVSRFLLPFVPSEETTRREKEREKREELNFLPLSRFGWVSGSAACGLWLLARAGCVCVTRRRTLCSSFSGSPSDVC